MDAFKKGLDALILRPISHLYIRSHPISQVPSPSLSHTQCHSLYCTKRLTPSHSHISQTLPSHPSIHPSTTCTCHTTRYTCIAQTILPDSTSTSMYVSLLPLLAAALCCTVCLAFYLARRCCLHRIHRIARIYRHFTYMLLAHVMQSALTGSLLRSGTALVDSRQRPSIDRRGRTRHCCT